MSHPQQHAQDLDGTNEQIFSRHQPPGVSEEDLPPRTPDQYLPHEASVHHAPVGFLDQYQPSRVPGPYPLAAAPVKYLSSTVASQYPQSSSPDRNSSVYHPVIAESGDDAENSDDDTRLYAKHSKHPVHVKFINRTDEKVELWYVNEKEKCKIVKKLKRGHSYDVRTYETHPYLVFTKSGRDVVINGNAIFLPENESEESGVVEAAVTYGPEDLKFLCSSASGHPVTVKFSNRTDQVVSLKRLGVDATPQPVKDILPQKAWVYNSMEGHYFIAMQRDGDELHLELNHYWFYLVRRSGKQQRAVKVIITHPLRDSSESSSISSDSD